MSVFHQHVGSSITETNADAAASSDDDATFGLDDLLPEPESPTPIPFSFATYELPDDTDLALPDERRHIIVRLVGTHPLWGHHLWNTARTLSTYLLRNPSLVHGKRILELGAGAGLPSIVSALAGAGHVVMTDYPDQQLVDNMRYNAECNLSSPQLDKVDVGGLVWGRKVDDLLAMRGQDGREARYDLLLLSDLVFNHSQHAALISSVDSLLCLNPPEPDTPTPCILIFFTHHRPHLAHADLDFLPHLAQSGGGWAYEKVVEDWTGPMFEQDSGDERVRGTVWGWRAWRVRKGEASGGVGGAVQVVEEGPGGG